MKIAVISDIHGNVQALTKVLDDVKKQQCDKIVCLGDLAMAGPEPESAINMVKDLLGAEKFELIQGNTDLYLGQNSEAIVQNIKKNNPIMGAAYENDLTLISKENKEFLKSLPEQKTEEIDGIKILYVHGSPRSNVENIFPSMPIEKVEEIIQDTDADVIFCGHTHQPCGYQTNSKQTVVNVGSVGRPLSEVPKACYAIIETGLQDNEFSVFHRNVDYDKEEAAKLLSQRTFEGSEKLAAMLLSAPERYPS